MIADLQIETTNLLLRPPRAEDFDAFAAFAEDQEATRFLGGTQPRAVAWRAFLAVVGAWQIQGFAFFSVIEKSSGRWVGRVGPWFPEQWPGREVGWSIARHAWRRGYATEAALAATDWALLQLGWTEVIHTIEAGNVASKAVAAKLGARYVREGRLLAPHNLDVEVWGQSREQWFAQDPGCAA